MTLPLWPFAAQVIGLRGACVDITEHQFRASSEPAADDPLALMQPGIQRGDESICTDVDGYRKTALEEAWNRITLLKVKLRNAAGTVLTANLSQERSAYDFYATAVHAARVRRMAAVFEGNGSDRDVNSLAGRAGMVRAALA